MTGGECARSFGNPQPGPAAGPAAGRSDGLVLGSYFTWLQQNDLRTQLLQRGKMIAEQLAPLAAPAMARLAPAQLEIDL